MSTFRIVHYLNQFFGGLGGEEKADAAPTLRAGPIGPGVLLHDLCRGQAEVAATVTCGDNRMAEHPAETLRAVLDLVREAKPDLLVAGPAFGSGRYGLACAAVCSAARQELGVPAVTAMSPDNPGAESRGAHVIVAISGPTASTMKADLERLARLAVKIGRREPLGAADDEGYLPSGRRVNEFGTKTGAERMVEMLLRKVRGEPFASEVVVPAFEPVPPAPPVRDLSTATLAVVTTSGLVGAGNPGGVESWRATKWEKYDISGLSELSPDAFTCVHGGYDTRHIRANPNRAVPLDALRASEREGRIGRLHDVLYTTVGNVMPVLRASQFGREIAAELRSAGVEAAIFTAT